MSDYEIVTNFLKLLEERGGLAWSRVTPTDEATTIHADICGYEIAFDFDGDDKLVDARTDE